MNIPRACQLLLHEGEQMRCLGPQGAVTECQGGRRQDLSEAALNHLGGCVVVVGGGGGGGGEEERECVLTLKI